MTDKPTTPPTSLFEDAIYTPRFGGDKRPRLQLMFSCFNACGTRFMDGLQHESYYNKYLDCLRICIIVADSSPGMNFREVVRMIGADENGHVVQTHECANHKAIPSKHS